MLGKVQNYKGVFFDYAAVAILVFKRRKEKKNQSNMLSVDGVWIKILLSNTADFWNPRLSAEMYAENGHFKSSLKAFHSD